MKKFRWLYIGNGNIAASTARSITKGDHEITAVYGRNKEKAQNFAKKWKAVSFDTLEEAVSSDIYDGVYIATPHTSHLNYALECMNNKKPVLCEKPVGVSVSEVDQLIESSKQNNVYFCEAMWTWFGKVAHTVRKWILDGEIGEVKEINVDYAFPGLMMSKNSRVLTPETAGGALLDIGIYPITYCYRIFGYPDEIKCTGELRNGIDVSETVTLKYGNTVCNLKMSLSFLKESCEIIGTKGKINVPMFHMASIATLKSGKKRKICHGKTDYLTEFNAVAKEIQEGKTESEYIPFSATRDCMKIMDECRSQLGLVYPFEK